MTDIMAQTTKYKSKAVDIAQIIPITFQFCEKVAHMHYYIREKVTIKSMSKVVEWILVFGILCRYLFEEIVKS